MSLSTLSARGTRVTGADAVPMCPAVSGRCGVGRWGSPRMGRGRCSRVGGEGGKSFGQGGQAGGKGGDISGEGCVGVEQLLEGDAVRSCGGRKLSR